MGERLCKAMPLWNRPELIPFERGWSYASVEKDRVKTIGQEVRATSLRKRLEQRPSEKGKNYAPVKKAKLRPCERGCIAILPVEKAGATPQ